MEPVARVGWRGKEYIPFLKKGAGPDLGRARRSSLGSRKLLRVREGILFL